MVELHRNDKIKILAVLAIIVGLVFFTFITIGIVVIGGIIGLFVYMFYKGIQKQIENFGNNPVKTTGEQMKDMKRRIKARQAGHRRMYNLGRRLARGGL